MNLRDALLLPEILHWQAELATLLEHASLQSFPQKLSAILSRVVEHQNVLIKFYQGDNDKPHILFHDYPPHQERHFIDAYLDEAWRLDPVLPALRQQPNRLVQINSQTAILTGSRYFQMYYRELRLDDEIDLLIALEDGGCLVLSIGRRGLPPADARDLAILNGLFPWLRYSLLEWWKAQFARTFQFLSQQRLGDVLNSFGMGLLTKREQGVAGLMLCGNGSKEIARNLSISLETVKVHRKSIYSKLNVHSELQLCNFFLRQTTASTPSS